MPRRTLAALRSDPRVELVDDERTIGNGIIVTLKDGLTIDPIDPHAGVFGEDTVRACFDTLATARPYTPGTGA